MDMFDQITRRVGGGDNRIMGSSRPSMPPQNTGGNPKTLGIMSDSAIDSLNDTLQKKYQSSRDSRTRNIIQNQIYSVQDEIAKRSIKTSSAEGDSLKPVAAVSPKEQEKIKSIGLNVGAGALIFGVLGFLVGATTEKPNRAMIWGLAGASIGGLAAFFMSKEDTGVKVINP